MTEPQVTYLDPEAKEARRHERLPMRFHRSLLEARRKHSLTMHKPTHHRAVFLASQISRISVTILNLYVAPEVIGYALWQTLWTTLDLLRGLKDLRVELATKEKYDRATMMKEDLGKVEEEDLLGYSKVLEGMPGRRKARWELVSPGEKRDGGSEVARELVKIEWTITRTGSAQSRSD